jgi:ParB family chromosome partitioning protein
MAAEWAGLTQVPAIVRNLDDDQAVIAMIDSNLQRERILPSEKAYAYKMRLEAMKHQGKRMPVELTSAQVEPKLQDG